MLNQTLTPQRLRAILSLASNHRQIQREVVELLKAEYDSVKDELLSVTNMEQLCRSQGAAQQLKELIQLFETPEGFKELDE